MSFGREIYWWYGVSHELADVDMERNVLNEVKYIASN